MESVIDLAGAVRAAKPGVFLNITSGTWLSPWWLQVADTIWMQGMDYGYANVPSISRRDRAITYRDVVLYENYGVHDYWFPIASLMTHGIIKGHLQKLGGEAEPLDKFTDNAVLYFARGVAMWELYVSPNLLTAEEWNAIVASIAWARDRFDTLMSTERVGGDPRETDAYGYAHFGGSRGIVAARNPFIEPRTLTVELAPAHGLDPAAASLVLERVYPSRWIAPRLYATGATVELELDGYETALYEIYPVEEADGPLLAGAVFEITRRGRETVLSVMDEGETRLLNADAFRELPRPGRLARLSAPIAGTARAGAGAGSLEADFQAPGDAEEVTLAVLLVPEEGAADPVVSARVDGAEEEPRVEGQEGAWAWHQIPVTPGSHQAALEVAPAEGEGPWRGTASVWVIAKRRAAATERRFEALGQPRPPRPMPPRPWPSGVLRSTEKLGEVRLGGS
jgi:hypothetical protein